MPDARSWSASPVPGPPSERLANGLRGTAARSCTSCARGRGGQAPRVVETAARELAKLRVERSEPLVAVGRRRARRHGRVPGRGLPARHPHPSTCRPRWSPRSIHRSAEDLREPKGKNLRTSTSPPRSSSTSRCCGPSPSANWGPRSVRRSRWRRSATSGCSNCSRRDGPAIARGDDESSRPASSPSWSSARAGPRSRSSWPTSASAAHRAAGSRLNLGHSLGHAFEAAGGYGGLLHGEAVAYGLRARPDRRRGGRHATGTRGADRPAARRPRAGRPSRSPTR